jgi:small nuclear ribonucleoprotein (snRNP)-like protein
MSNKNPTRPFDFLQRAIGKRVVVEIEDAKIEGVLISFDASLNLVLKEATINDKIKLPVVFLRSIKGLLRI